jgi:hypothetical protein
MASRIPCLFSNEMNTGVNNDNLGSRYIGRGLVGLLTFLHHFSSGRFNRVALFLSCYHDLPFEN